VVPALNKTVPLLVNGLDGSVRMTLVALASVSHLPNPGRRELRLACVAQRIVLDGAAKGLARNGTQKKKRYVCSSLYSV
jgi:hypothetical protein